MRVTTLETFAGRVIEETLGVVRGSSIWTRRISKNSTAGHRALEHMTMDEVSDGLSTVREKAEAKMIINATNMGADGVIALKVELIELGNDMFQAIAYGTAVRSDSVSTATPFSTRNFGDVAIDYDSVVLPFQPRRKFSGGIQVH